ncbi:hypothetical protein AX16_009561 [Volvariella volvacea WC 439]|nr:hypothetical protein AX16_009561 [Volvariella volvacea WC 439]
MASAASRITLRFSPHLRCSNATLKPRRFGSAQHQSCRHYASADSAKLRQTPTIEPTTLPLTRKTKVEEYLDQLAATKTTLTLEDIERYRPKSHAKPGTPQYEEDYHNVVETLVRSFTRQQLHKFIDLYGLGRPSHRTKRNYAVAIVERQWNWPSLTELQRRHKDNTEVITMVHPLNAQQSFHILGSDGSNLLSLSTKYNIRMSLSADPLALRAEGIRGSLRQLENEIDTLRKSIITETFKLPRVKNIPSQYLQRISRLSGAFVENIDNGMIRISYKNTDPKAADMAKRLATQIIIDDSINATLVLSVPREEDHEESGHPRTYSLYPFLSSNQVPWTANSKNLFRLRQVGNWLGVTDSTSVAGAGMSISNMYSTDGSLFDVIHWLSSTKPPAHESQGYQRTLVASLGHSLFYSPGQGPTFVSPVEGSLPWTELRPWIHDHRATRTFCPSIPILGHEGFTRASSAIRRLVYMAAGGVSNENTIELEVFEPKMGNSSSNIPLDETPELRCWVGRKSTAEVLLPDRPMDLRLSILDRYMVSHMALPDSLKAYIDQHQAHWSQEGIDSHSEPEPPLRISYRGTVYTLFSYTFVRRNVQVAQPLLSTSEGGITTMFEHVVDLSSSQRYSECKISFDIMESESSITTFLQECDRLNMRTKQIKAADILQNILRA